MFFFPAQRRGVPQARDTPRPALRRLSDYLLTNYKKGVRPVRDWRKPTTVAIDVIVYAILSVVSAPPQSAPTQPVVRHRGSGQMAVPIRVTAAQTRKRGGPGERLRPHPCSGGSLTTRGSSQTVSW